MSEADRLLEAVWRSEWRLLRRPLAEVASAVGARVYLVGGYVRDLLLERPPGDFDLTVEGDGLGFAERLGELLGGEVRVSRRFLTAQVSLPPSLRVDVATARAERYERPGALPTVEPAGIEADLRRRDFTVNTLALRIAGGSPRLLAAGGARDDLAAGRLRVLHDRSFEDDPTRLLRAVRQEVRLGFRLEPHSEQLARQALSSEAFDTVSGERLWCDLEPLLRPDSIGRGALERLDELGGLAALHRGLGWSREQRRLYEGALRALDDWDADHPVSRRRQVETEVALLSLGPGPGGVGWGAEIAERLRLPSWARRTLSAWSRHAEAAHAAVRSADASASSVHAALGELPVAGLALLAADLEGEARRWVRREWDELRRVALDITAKDLLARGHAEGPSIGRSLEETLAARLDGEIGPEEELDYALQRLEAIASQPGRPEKE